MTKISAAVLPLVLAASVAHAGECGNVTIAEMNWSSASLMANVDRFILEHGYGCEAELVPGDTMPTSTSMVEKGEPDIAPEMWSNSARKALDKGVAEGRLRYASNSLSDGGEEGFWVPDYLVKQYPEMTHIDGIVKHAKMFKHPEDPSVSAFYSCPAGWACQITAGNLFKALKLADSGFEVVDPGSGAALAGSIAKAYEQEKPWFGYYWAPTSVLGKYKMTKVDFGTGADKNEYDNCTTKDTCESPKVTMYPPSQVQTIVTEDFAQRAPGAYDYLTKRAFTNSDMNELLAWMEDNQADGDLAMEHFLNNYPQLWQPWVSKEVADKVKSALNNL